MIKLRNFNLEKIDKIKHYSLLMKLNRDKNINKYISHNFISFLDKHEAKSDDKMEIGKAYVVNKDKKNAKLAKLDYEVLAYNEVKNLSLVRVNLHTGRHHQIRVQLSHAGHSIFGDQKYGTRGQGKQIALWAYELTIEHPITKEEMTFKCLPESNGTWCILRDVSI